MVVASLLQVWNGHKLIVVIHRQWLLTLLVCRSNEKWDEEKVSKSSVQFWELVYMACKKKSKASCHLKGLQM